MSGATSTRWAEAVVPLEIAVKVQPGTRLFWRDVPDGQLRVMVSPPFGESGWHLSISHALSLLGPDGRLLPGRYPTWDEIRDARYDLLDDSLTMAMLLPPRGEYVDIHPTTFHLHELPGGAR